MRLHHGLTQVLFELVCLSVLNLLVCHTGKAQRDTSYPQRRYKAEVVDCQNVSEVVFLSFFPCLQGRDTSSRLTASEKLSECDLLAEAAAHLAVERVNQDPDILPNITLKLHPIFIPKSEELVTVRHWCYQCKHRFYHDYPQSMMYRP